MNDSDKDFVLLLKRKDAIGLYISLKQPGCHLTDSSARILKKIEDYLYTFLTIDQFDNIEDIYINY